MSTVIIQCSGPKLDRPAPAQELYQSGLFKKCRQWAVMMGKPWFILSAKWGILDPTWTVHPYDCTTGDKDHITVAALRPMIPQGPIITLCGTTYVELMRKAGARDITEPMRGLPVGFRLQWLNRNTPRDYYVSRFLGHGLVDMTTPFLGDVHNLGPINQEHGPTQAEYQALCIAKGVHPSYQTLKL